MLISINIIYSNENKTSQLEQFLFKIGFHKTLENITLSNKKSQLNEKEIKKLKSKLNLINKKLQNKHINIYKDSKDKSSYIKNEILLLKEEIHYLKHQISSYYEQSCKYNVLVENLNVRNKNHIKGKILRVLKKDDQFTILRKKNGWLHIDKIYKNISKNIMNVKSKNNWIKQLDKNISIKCKNK
jgi:hypothetical protein